MAPMLYHGLSQLGLPVVCVESRQAYQALKSLATHKTDRNDARGLAHLARTGFFKPVHNLPTMNAVHAGQAVPVRFSLTGNHGLAIFAAGSPRIEFVSCTTLVPQSTQSTTGGLTYKASSDQYTYTWKTDRAWRGTCGFLRVEFNDGTSIDLNDTPKILAEINKRNLVFRDRS